MAPTVPPPFLGSSRGGLQGRSAATAIPIDDSDDDQSVPAPEATLLIVSSDDEGDDVDVDSSSVRSVNILEYVSARGGSEATSQRKRRAPRPRPSAVPVRSPVVVSAEERPRSQAPSVVVLVGSPDGRDDDDDATSQHKKTKEPRPQAPSVVLPIVSCPAASADGRDDSIVVPGGSPVVSDGPAASANGRDATRRHKKDNKEPRPRSPPSVVSSAANAAPSADGTHEATSRHKRKKTSWVGQDELTILTTMAERRRDNNGVLETGSLLLNKLLEDDKILRRGLRATQLSNKLRHLKKKFILAAEHGGPGNVGGRKYRRRCQYHNNKLYEISKEVWPELLPAAQERATTSSQQPTSSSATTSFE
ncbi:hypothetical protein BS78_06G001200 [Paspalum vaginatum]|nr:hypothetical protein BS78_06G001200 [Paspalum vaginatum]